MKTDLSNPAKLDVYLRELRAKFDNIDEEKLDGQGYLFVYMNSDLQRGPFIAYGGNNGEIAEGLAQGGLAYYPLAECIDAACQGLNTANQMSMDANPKAVQLKQILLYVKQAFHNHEVDTKWLKQIFQAYEAELDDQDLLEQMESYNQTMGK